MKLKELLSKINRDYFYLMHLSYGGDYRKKLWRYAYKSNLIGLDFEGINREWRNIPQRTREKLTQVWQHQFKLFCEDMKKGDCVLVTDGMSPSYLLGVGLVDGDYFFDEKRRRDFFGHVRHVRWLIRYKYENRQPFKAYFRRTILRIDPSSSLWKLVNREIDIKKSISVPRGPLIRRYEPSEQEIERAKNKFMSGDWVCEIDIDHEIETLNTQSPQELAKELKRRPIIKAGSKTVDISAEVNLTKSKMLIGNKPVYVERNLKYTTLETYKKDAVEFWKTISRIERLFGIEESKFTILCIDGTPSRDAFVLKGNIFCNIRRYKERKSFSYWLITLAREFAYLMNPRRDMRHMNLMRELLVKALQKTCRS